MVHKALLVATAILLLPVVTNCAGISLKKGIGGTWQFSTDGIAYGGIGPGGTALKLELSDDPAASRLVDAYARWNGIGTVADVVGYPLLLWCFWNVANAKWTEANHYGLYASVATLAFGRMSFYLADKRVKEAVSVFNSNRSQPTGTSASIGPALLPMGEPGICLTVTF